jgi:hypothetical protein
MATNPLSNFRRALVTSAQVPALLAGTPEAHVHGILKDLKDDPEFERFYGGVDKSGYSTGRASFDDLRIVDKIKREATVRGWQDVCSMTENDIHRYVMTFRKAMQETRKELRDDARERRTLALSGRSTAMND